MGNCCKKASTEEIKVTIDLEDQKAALQNTEELEVRFEEMLKNEVDAPPHIKVRAVLASHT